MNMNPTTSSGRSVTIDQLLVQRSDLGFLEGEEALIRAQVIQDVAKNARRHFGEGSGFHLQYPNTDYLPEFLVIADLSCLDPVTKGADCSSLLFAWFTDSPFSEHAQELIERLVVFDWEHHAVDGYY